MGANRQTFQYVAAGAFVLLAVAAAWTEHWPFDAAPQSLPRKPTLAQLILSDRYTLGFVRLGLLMLGVFIVASIPALIVGGRWLKTFGTSGVTADDAVAEGLDDLRDQLKEAKTNLAQAQRERDAATAAAHRARAIADQMLRER